MNAFCEHLTKHWPKNVHLAPEIRELINWLEGKEQVFVYRHTKEPFLPSCPVPSIDDLFSHIAFQKFDDITYWFGREGIEADVLPFIRCGGDGSMIALWRQNQANDSYVFLGSEGEAFVLAEAAADLIVIITMGYESIEERSNLTLTPNEHWAQISEQTWPEPKDVKGWVSESFGVTYPPTGEAILPYSMADDPFET